MKPETSGTAVRIAEALNIEKENIKSIRAGGIIGVHEVLFGFPFQTVRIKHESISREAFGNGAKFAVEELMKKQNGFYSMEELIGPYFLESNRSYENKLVEKSSSKLTWIRLKLSKYFNSLLNRWMSSK